MKLYDYSNKQLKSTKTGYIAEYEFWVELAIDTLGRIANSTPDQYVIAQIWLGELVEFTEKSKDVK